MQDVTALFDAMTDDERNEFIALYLDELKQQRQARKLLELAQAANASAMALLPSDGLPQLDYRK